MVDIEAAFLNGDLEEELHVEWPEGVIEHGCETLEMARRFVIRCTKGMCGAVQSAHAWFKTFSTKLKSLKGCHQSEIDPCLWFCKKDGESRGRFRHPCRRHRDRRRTVGYR